MARLGPAEPEGGETEDGGEDVIAVPRSTLGQGPREGWDSIARILAGEWQEDG